MAGVGVGGDEVAGARGDLKGGPGGAGGPEHRSVGARKALPDPRGRLAQVGCQGRQGDLEALRTGLVLIAGSQEVGPDQSGGTRGCEGTPVRLVSQGEGLEVTCPNVASKRPRIAFEARRG